MNNTFGDVLYHVFKIVSMTSSAMIIESASSYRQYLKAEWDK